MTISTVRHGTLSTYKFCKCRCSECVEHSNRYHKKLRYELAVAGSRRVDSTRAVEHMRALMDAGMSTRAIADQLGYASTRSVQVLARRPTILRSTERRVLALTFTSDLDERRVVDATGTRRRLRALAWMGWRQMDVASAVGVDARTVSEICNGHVRRVRALTHVRVKEFFEANWDRDGGSVRMRNIARRRGWLPPLAWDDIDDPRENARVFVRRSR